MSRVIQETSSKKFTRNQWVLLILFSVSNFCGGLIYSVLAAFYPAEASKRGVPATEYGFVFGVYELTNFLLAPIFGIYMGKLGPKITLLAGTFLMALMTFLFSFVDNLDDHTIFITTSFLLRIPQAIGATAIMTASFTIIAIVFTNSVSTSFAIIETVFGFGTCIGPTIGAALFEVGGFLLTFGALGIIIMLVTPMFAYALWNKDLSINSLTLDIGEKNGILDLMKIIPVCLVIIANAINTTCAGTFTVLLEPHLRQFEIGPFGTGLMFLLYGIVYAISAPCWGILCDRVSQPFYIILSGAILFFIGFLFIGPAPFIPLQSTLWMTGLGLTFAGIGSGAITVSSFAIGLRKARENGFPDSLGTYSLVSGMWTSSYALGAFIGPSLAGILFDAMGFRNQTGVILLIQLILIITLAIYIRLDRRAEGENRNEIELPPSLQSNTNKVTKFDQCVVSTIISEH